MANPLDIPGGVFGGGNYNSVAANTVNMAMGTIGAKGDFLSGVTIIPGTTAAGIVNISDGGGANITIFQGGGTTALSSLIPFFVVINARSKVGGWTISTGLNVVAVGSGVFT